MGGLCARKPGRAFDHSLAMLLLTTEVVESATLLAVVMLLHWQCVQRSLSGTRSLGIRATLSSTRHQRPGQGLLGREARETKHSDSLLASCVTLNIQVGPRTAFEVPRHWQALSAPLARQ